MQALRGKPSAEPEEEHVSGRRPDGSRVECAQIICLTSAMGPDLCRTNHFRYTSNAISTALASTLAIAAMPAGDMGVKVTLPTIKQDLVATTTKTCSGRRTSVQSVRSTPNRSIVGKGANEPNT